MIEVKYIITEDQYKMLGNMDTKHIHEYIEDIACHSGYHPAGYGFSDPCFGTDGNNYFVTWKRYESCD